MIKEEPNIRPMATFGRKEASAILNISVRTFSYYVERGIIQIGGINPINNRAYYYGRDIISLWKKYTHG